MTKKTVEPDEMRMPADEFDTMMRRALGAPPPPGDAKKPAKPKEAKGGKAHD